MNYGIYKYSVYVRKRFETIYDLWVADNYVYFIRNPKNPDMTSVPGSFELLLKRWVEGALTISNHRPAKS